MDLIGPTFAAELIVAGVPVDGIAWGADGALSFRDDVPPEVVVAAIDVRLAHDPSKQPAPATPVLTDGQLAEVLIAKGVITSQDVAAAVAAADEPQK